MTTLPAPGQVHNLSAAEAVALAHEMNPTPPNTELTLAEKLAILDIVMKTWKPTADLLRAAVAADMKKAHAERVGAYLPDGTKVASVSYSDGNVSARVVNEAYALIWCAKRYPDEIVKSINPAFLKTLLDHAKKVGKPGEKGVDPRTGEELPFIEVTTTKAYVTVTPTEEGPERVMALAGRFIGELEPPK